MPKRRSTVEDLAKARMARVTGLGAGGFQAMTIGLTLGGCVGAGYMIGAWLDSRFRTGFCMPMGVFLGMAAGFREMFRTLKRISSLTKWPGASSHDSSHDANDQPNDGLVAATTTSVAAQTKRRSQVQTAPEEQAPRKRLFEVPEPPLPSHERDKHAATTAAQPTLRLDEVPDTLHELMGAEKYAELQAELKALKENDSDKETGDTSSYERKKPQ